MMLLQKCAIVAEIHSYNLQKLYSLKAVQITMVELRQSFYNRKSKLYTIREIHEWP